MKYDNYIPLKNKPDASETSFWINFTAFIVVLMTLLGLRFAGFKVTPYMFLIMAAVLTFTIVVLEKIFYPQTNFYRRWHIRRKVNWIHIFYKEITLLLTLGVIGFLYWLFPMYSYDDFTLRYFPFLRIFVPILLLGSIPYFCLMDKIDDEPEDVYYKIGYAIIHRQKTLSRFELGNYARSWLVKGFWLSLMQPYMMTDINWLFNLVWENIKNKPIEWFWFANSFCFFIDLTFASVGYLMNFKLLNSQTRTAEPTLLGWMVAIMCYWPFWGVLFYQYFFRYEKIGWMSVFVTESTWWWVWFISIILLELLYALATVAAGIRFSNLTYRGLWNTGPYKWSKHPAYVCKNISWWLIAMPFMINNTEEAIKACFMLIGVNVIYYLRAKTEERHLSHYPEYEEYALKMNEKSIFTGVAKILPFLKYKPLKKEDRLF